MRGVIGAVALLGASCGTLAQGPSTLRDLPLDVLHDKIAGGWAGQMIGVSYGAPTEFRFQERTIASFSGSPSKRW